MIEVLGRASSINVRKVLWTCAELNLQVRQVPWGEGDLSLRSPEFLVMNPGALVPVLRDGAFVLRESNAICRYLAARQQRTDLLPAEPAARAKVEQWMDWQATELNPSWGYVFNALVRKNPDYQDPQRIQAGVQAWNDKMALLEQQLTQTGAYVAGEEFTLADILIGLSVHRWQMTPMERPPYPAIAAYYQRLSQHAGFKTFALDGHD